MSIEVDIPELSLINLLRAYQICFSSFGFDKHLNYNDREVGPKILRELREQNPFLPGTKLELILEKREILEHELYVFMELEERKIIIGGRKGGRKVYRQLYEKAKRNMENYFRYGHFSPDKYKH